MKERITALGGRTGMYQISALYIFLGLMGGLAGWKLKLPGGIIVGSMVAVLLYKVISGQAGQMPFSMKFAAQVLLGVVVGSMYEPALAEKLKTLIVPVAVSTVGLVAAGLLVTVVLARLGIMDATTAYLATSPGGLSAVTGLALSAEADPSLVLTFHFVRVTFISVSAPLVFQLLTWLTR